MKKEKIKILREKYAGSYIGKRSKIKPVRELKEFVEYFIQRAKRVLELTKKEYDSFHIDLIDLKSIEVWFFNDTRIVAMVKFIADGRKIETDDKREGKGRWKSSIS